MLAVPATLMSAVATILAILVCIVTLLFVARTRGMYGVAAPAMNGHPTFERASRVQMNTLEQFVIFLPSLWLATLYFHAIGWLPAALGILWSLGRLVYAVGYMAHPEKRHVGFGLTYSSTFMHPFYVARLLNSLDHVTNGRIAFNVVTSTRRSDAANYGFDELLEHNSRYNRMEEFVDVCKALWSSVEPDAFVWDRETGVVVEDPGKVRAINHSGPFFKVKGPLPCVPSPQRRPVAESDGRKERRMRDAGRGCAGALSD